MLKVFFDADNIGMITGRIYPPLSKRQNWGALFAFCNDTEVIHGKKIIRTRFQNSYYSLMAEK